MTSLLRLFLCLAVIAAVLADPQTSLCEQKKTTEKSQGRRNRRYTHILEGPTYHRL